MHDDAVASVANSATSLTEIERISRFAALAGSARDPSPLVNAINACCEARGDDARNRAELIAECSRLPVQGQAEMREHFEQQAELWEKANRGRAP